MSEVLPLNTSPLPVRLRVEDYLLLDSSGAFEPYAKTELIDGEILFMNAQHRPHARVKMGLYDAIRDALNGTGSPSTAFVEASIAMPDYSVPEPDIVLTDEPDGEGLIPLRSVTLVVEVADTTLAGDLGRKARLYATAGISEYWVADVKGRILHQMWSPTGGTYTENRDIAFGTAITAATMAGLTVETHTL
jgi:Uma2 family endonuclease